MKHGKREMPRQRRNNKGMTALVALVLIFCCSIGGTLAWLMTATDPVTNTFEPAAVKCVVEERTSGTQKSDVYVSIPVRDGTTKTTDAYVRATFVVNWAKDDAENTVYATKPVEKKDYTIVIPTDTGWTKRSDGYYYFNRSVAPGDKTGILITSCEPVAGAEVPAGYHLQVTILAEGIQADGTTSGGQQAVVNAWGVDPSTLS